MNTGDKTCTCIQNGDEMGIPRLRSDKKRAMRGDEEKKKCKNY